MPSVPEELNVFRRPHGHMMKLVKDIEREVCITRPGLFNSVSVQGYRMGMCSLETILCVLYFKFLAGLYSCVRAAFILADFHSITGYSIVCVCVCVGEWVLGCGHHLSPTPAVGD